MNRPDISRDELIAIVTRALADVARLRVGPDQYGENLFQLGLDSLTAISVINRIEEDLDLMIDDSWLKRFTSINAIADFFENLPAA